MWKKLNSMVAAPLLSYLFLITVSCLAFGISEFYFPQEQWKNIVQNIAYGVFGSTLVAALIDYATTIRKREQDKTTFFVLTKKMRENIDWLINYRMIFYKDQQADQSDMNYVDWLFKQLKNSYEIYLKIMFESLGNSAKSLKENAILLVNNFYLPDNFFTNLDLLIEKCNTISKKLPKKDDDFKDNLRGIFDLITEIFPEYKNIFTGSWNRSEVLSIKRQIVTQNIKLSMWEKMLMNIQLLTLRIALRFHHKPKDYELVIKTKESSPKR